MLIVVRCHNEGFAVPSIEVRSYADLIYPYKENICAA